MVGQVSQLFKSLYLADRRETPLRHGNIMAFEPDIARALPVIDWQFFPLINQGNDDFESFPVKPKKLPVRGTTASQYGWFIDPPGQHTKSDPPVS